MRVIRKYAYLAAVLLVSLLAGCGEQPDTSSALPTTATAATTTTTTALPTAGTAIQNLRTSYMGDTLTRDGYHLEVNTGRYTVSMTWALL